MTQSERVLAYIQGHDCPTTMEIQLGLYPFVSNPRARISDLRKAGHDIRAQKRADGQTGFRVIEQPEQLRLAV